MEDAIRVWENKGLKRDAVAYNTIIRGFCRAGEVVMQGVESTCITFEHLINGYCEIGDVDSALMLYKDMCRKQFSPSSCIVNVIIRLLCDKNEISAASDFWWRAAKKHGAALERENYVNLVKGLCGEGKMEEASNLQAEMVLKGFEPNVDMYGAFINGYVVDIKCNQVCQTAYFTRSHSLKSVVQCMEQLRGGKISSQLKRDECHQED